MKKRDLQVAETIAKQIGRGALFMIGAKNLVADINFLAFKIGRNSKGVNYVKIILTPLDLYEMKFMRIRAGKVTVLKTENGVYFDMLNSLIEKNTGLCTHL